MQLCLPADRREVCGPAWHNATWRPRASSCKEVLHSATSDLMRRTPRLLFCSSNCHCHCHWTPCSHHPCVTYTNAAQCWCCIRHFFPPLLTSLTTTPSTPWLPIRDVRINLLSYNATKADTQSSDQVLHQEGESATTASDNKMNLHNKGLREGNGSHQIETFPVRYWPFAAWDSTAVAPAKLTLVCLVFSTCIERYCGL